MQDRAQTPQFRSPDKRWSQFLAKKLRWCHQEGPYHHLSGDLWLDISALQSDGNGAVRSHFSDNAQYRPIEYWI